MNKIIFRALVETMTDEELSILNKDSEFKSFYKTL